MDRFREYLKNNRQVIIAVLITAVVVSGLTYTFTKKSVTDLTVTTIPNDVSQGGTCTDSDAKQGSEAIFMKGEVTYISPDGTTSTSKDECVSGKDEVHEWVCKLLPTGGSEPQKDIIPCEYGCTDGACAKESSNVRSVVLPSPITWEQNGTRLSLAGARLGPTPAPRDLLKFPGGGIYKEGEMVHGLALIFKVEAPSEPECVALDIRRLLNEEGDMVAPNTRRFSFPDGVGCVPKADMVYQNQEVIFVVPESANEFVLTSGEAGIFFTVKAATNGRLEVRVSSEEG